MDVTDKPASRRYEAEVDGATAFVEYSLRGARIALLHTEVPKSLSGRGVGSTLAQGVLDDVRRRGLTLEPSPMCSFIAAWIERHPQYRDLVGGAEPGGA